MTRSATALARWKVEPAFSAGSRLHLLISNASPTPARPTQAIHITGGRMSHGPISHAIHRYSRPKAAAPTARTRSGGVRVADAGRARAPSTTV
ncbi:hypothetical protein BH23ACT8_BH23ACT8_21120 [soil metagenome]